MDHEDRQGHCACSKGNRSGIEDEERIGGTGARDAQEDRTGEAENVCLTGSAQRGVGSAHGALRQPGLVRVPCLISTPTWHTLWLHLRKLEERHYVGRALSREERAALLEAV